MSRLKRALSSLSLAVVVLGAGCASTSIGPDVALVRDYSRAEAIAAVEDGEEAAQAQEHIDRLLRRPLGADEAIQVALLHNPELRAALFEMGVARGRLIQEGLLPNPVVEAELPAEHGSRLELRLEYDLTRALLTPMRSDAAEPALVAERYRVAALIVDLSYRVRAAIYALMAAEQQLALGQRLLDGLAAGRDAAQSLADAGNVSEIDRASQEAAYQRARLGVAQLELDVAERREVLQRLLGLHGHATRWQLTGTLSDAPQTLSIPDDLEARAIAANLELMQARQRIESLSRRESLSRTEGLVPDVAVSLLAQNAEREEMRGDHSWRFGGGITVGVPLFDRRQGQAASLAAARAALRERQDGLAVDVRSAARDVSSRLRSAHARALHSARVVMPAQRRMTEQTLLHYNAMQLGIFDLLRAQREQLAVELTHIETLRELWTTHAELDALLAGKTVMRARSGATPAALIGDDDNEARGH